MIGRDEYRLAPSLLVVSDQPDDHGATDAFVRSAGGQLRDIVAPAVAIAWLDQNGPVDTVLVDVAADHGAALDRLLDRLGMEAGAGRQSGVVAIPSSLIDIAAARVSAESITLLANPTPAEISAAVATALAQGARGAAPQLHEETREPRLRQLSEEVGRIARTLAELSGGVSEPRNAYRAQSPGEPGDGGGGGREPTAARVRAAIRGRRLRDQFFDSTLFADPAWDMLLDLAAARLEGRKVAVSSLCIAAAVPATTALRWIKALVDEGLFVRIADPRDGRRVFIELSDGAHDHIRAYFRALDRAGIAPGS